MIVTDIIPIDKKRSKIYIDGQYRFPLYQSEIKKYGIRRDEEVSEGTVAELSEQVVGKRAILRAMNLLTKRPYTEERLRQKLRDGHYPEKLIDRAVDYVKSYGYIDDEAYARDFIVYHMQDMSRKQMEQKLLAKGIAKDCIYKVLEEEMKEDGTSCEQKQIRQLFQKKYGGEKPKDRSQYAKMMGFFLRKGYSAGDVRRALGDSIDDMAGDMAGDMSDA